MFVYFVGSMLINIEEKLNWMLLLKKEIKMRRNQIVVEQNYLDFIFKVDYEAPEELAIRDSQVLPDKRLFREERSKNEKI